MSCLMIIITCTRTGGQLCQRGPHEWSEEGRNLPRKGVRSVQYCCWAPSQKTRAQF